MRRWSAEGAVLVAKATVNQELLLRRSPLSLGNRLGFGAAAGHSVDIAHVAQSRLVVLEDAECIVQPSGERQGAA
jgi:hypothetical protein